MALSDVKDQIKEKFLELFGKIQESQVYNNIAEKYETLSPGAQKGIVSGGVILGFLILVSIPISYYSSSSSAIEEYDNTRQLIRALLRASRIASESSNLPALISSEELKARIQNDLSSFQLLPEQVGGVSDLESDKMGSPLAPSSISQSGVGLSLKKLNLKQVVDIGFQLQNINPSVKLAGLEVVAGTPDPHYFDVLYKLVVFTLPSISSEVEDAGPGSKGGAKANDKGPGGKATAKGPALKKPPQFRDVKPKGSDAEED